VCVRKNGPPHYEKFRLLPRPRLRLLRQRLPLRLRLQLQLRHHHSRPVRQNLSRRCPRSSIPRISS
jgi:hypothetical protein